MLFSISIPVYNAEQHIDKAITSVISQDFNDYELVLVNDGSTDNSLSLCNSWAKKYPNIIKVINQENSGSLKTRRKCLQECQGDYIYIMDADDFITRPDFLKTVNQVIQKYRVDLILFNAQKDNQLNNIYCQLPYNNLQIFENSQLAYIYERVILDNALNPLWNKLFSRKLVDWDVDYTPFYKVVTNGTDFFQSLPIVFNAKKAIYLNQTFYNYNTANTNSIVHSFKPSIYESLKQNFLRLTNYCNSKYKLKNDDLIKRRFMNLVSTSVIKLRLLKPQAKFNRLDYLTQIREDLLFDKYYTLTNISFLRKVVIFLLKLRKYRLLIFFLRIVSILYKK